MQAADYYNSRPRKATGAAVLYFNTKGELLIVKPTYLDRWLWPGGGIEENETPLQAAIRESNEEIGISPEGLKLAFVQYRSPKPDGQNESIFFVFAAQMVGDDFLDHLQLAGGEIEDAKFVAVSELSKHMSAERAAAVNAYVQDANRGVLYIEDVTPMA